MDEFETFILGLALGFFGLLIYFEARGVPKDAEVMRQLMKPCIDYGYTKAKCREMIYIPQSEVK